MREIAKLIKQIKELVKPECTVNINAADGGIEISITALKNGKRYRNIWLFTYTEIFGVRDIDAFQKYVIEDMCYQFNCEYTASGT